MDRNLLVVMPYLLILMSLSARRAWIEMFERKTIWTVIKVALRKESVDRNFDYAHPGCEMISSRSPQGERG